MTKKKSNNIEKTLELYFKNKEIEKIAKAEKDRLQKEIDAYSEEHITKFKDGVLFLESAKIQIMQNPPKAVHEGSFKALTTAERTELANNLDRQYVKESVDLSKVNARLAGDKNLKQLLKSLHIEIVQENRFTAKPL